MGTISALHADRPEPVYQFKSRDISPIHRNISLIAAFVYHQRLLIFLNLAAQKLEV